MPSPLRTAAALLVWIALGAGAGGCLSAGEAVHLPLFFERESLPDSEWTALPLLLSGHQSRRAEDEERGYVLWPLFGWVREGRELELRALGIPWYRRWVDAQGFLKTDLLLGPVLTGHSRAQGRYLTVLPFGGTLHRKLGKDYLLWILPPLYVYTEDQRPAGLMRSHHLLWPLINWVEGGGYSGFRVLPLYAHYRREDLEGRLAFERTWILWPLWTHQRNAVNNPAGEQRLWQLWPLFGRLEGPDESMWQALWPLFRYYENRSTGAQGPYWELRAPFPFVVIGRGRTQSRTDLWPLWGRRERLLRIATEPGGFDRWQRHFVLWPLWRYEEHETNAFADTKWWLLPLVWSYARAPKPGHEAELAPTRTFKLWPLLRYRRHADGRVTLNLFSPLWFNDPEGAFERIYNPLTRIYEHVENSERERLLLLWGLFQQYSGPEGEGTIVHPWLFWDRSSADGSERDTGVLFGLFRYLRHGSRKALRLFWLPPFPTWGEQEQQHEPPAAAGGAAHQARAPEGHQAR
ncbi:MAG: hypothetical protein KatS3mg102_1123 [Planctomycetota bacterium]|nr:MAG: hypothetical protein KatS3mg102_1123 [Planctomycetota bacterium]